MSERMKNLAALIAAMTKAFVGIKDGDTALKSGVKASTVGLKWSSYYWLDWVIFGFYGSVATAMRHYTFSFADIFYALWAMEVVIAAGFLVFNKVTGEDITLGKNLRNSWDVLNKGNRILGILGLVWLIIKLVFWDGSERASGFFMKETDTTKKMVLLIVVVSGTKMLAYTWLFSLGYDVFSKN